MIRIAVVFMAGVAVAAAATYAAVNRLVYGEWL